MKTQPLVWGKGWGCFLKTKSESSDPPHPPPWRLPYSANSNCNRSNSLWLLQQLCHGCSRTHHMLRHAACVCHHLSVMLPKVLSFKSYEFGNADIKTKVLTYTTTCSKLYNILESWTSTVCQCNTSSELWFEEVLKIIKGNVVFM